MARRKGDPVPEVELPITPMLDMAFQIFAFFIATYHPSSLEGQVELALPASGEARAQQQDLADQKNSDTEIDLKTEVTVTVKTPHGSGATGSIDTLSIEGAEGTEKPVPVDLDKDPRLNGLKDALAKMRKGLSNKDGIKIKPDSGLKYAYVVRVMDACREAGFKNIGFAPPGDLGGP